MPIDRPALVSDDGKLLIDDDGTLADKDCCCTPCSPGNGLPSGAPYFSSVTKAIDFDITASYTTPIETCDASGLGYFCNGLGNVPIGAFDHLTGTLGPDVPGVDPDITVNGPFTPDSYFDAPGSCGVCGLSGAVALSGSALSGSWCEYLILFSGLRLTATVGECPHDPVTGFPCADSGELWIYICCGLRYGTINGDGPGWHLTYGSSWTPAGSPGLQLCGCQISGLQCETLFLGEEDDAWIGTFNTTFDYFTLSFTLSPH